MNLLKQKQNSIFTAEMSVQENTMLSLTQHINLFSFNLTNFNVKKVYERNI